MPKLCITSTTSKMGVNYVRDVVERSNCLFQKIDQENDLGIDGLIELIEDEEPINKLFAVQIKSGESYFLKKTEQCRIPIENHREYWANHPLPVYGIVYVPSRRDAYWVDIKAFLKNNPDATVIKFFASEANQFNEDKLMTIFIPHVLRQIPNIPFNTALTFFRSGKQLEFFIGLEVLFRRYINNKAVWDEFIEYFRNADVEIIPPILIYYFAHIPWHGDILGAGEMPTKETKEYVQKFFNQFSKKEIIKLLSLIDEEDMISRGSVGQSVEAIVSSLTNSKALLNSVLADKNISLHVREAAAIIFAMNWPEIALKQLECLESEGSWYAGELTRYIKEWGAFNPYA